MNDVSTTKSRTGYIISFAGCPITWASKLQTQIALSTTEAEYIALLQCLREVIPMINLTTEFNRLGVCSYCTVPKVYCKAFEDNSGALELAKTQKMRPRTKHINLVFHHFRDYVRCGLIVIYPVGTLEACIWLTRLKMYLRRDNGKRLFPSMRLAASFFSFPSLIFLSPSGRELTQTSPRRPRATITIVVETQE
jgi:hypothetical protein